MLSKPEKFWRVTHVSTTRPRCSERETKITFLKTQLKVRNLNLNNKLKKRKTDLKKLLFIEKILKVPVADSDHVRTGWWIEFRIVKSE